jgi:hypothetical protein
MYRVQITWAKRREIIIAGDKQTLDNLLAWHNNKPKGQGYCRVKLLEAA